jgi:serine/threonine-protein kinase
MAGPDTELAPGTTWSCPTCQRSYPAEFTVCPLDATPRGETSKSADALIGSVLGRTYKITGVLGQGGMARLYMADHLRIEQKFAIKIIHDELAAEPSLLTRFEREARAAGKIKSEHVVRLIDVLRTPDDRPCMVTELLEGEDLGARLERVKKLSVAEAIPIARQICRGVAAAHAVGVVHRDLKPSNIFLCRTVGGPPLVKIFDFGVAKLEDDEKLTSTGAVMGTAAYMPPEQALRAAEVGPLADVYAIGAILYHMLAGEMPYGNLPAVSRFALLLQQEPARPRSLEPSIPEGVEAVIQHAMARDKAARVASAVELEEQLAAFDLPVNAAAAAPVAAPREVTDVTAQSIALRARVARPAAVTVAIASSLAAGAWLAVLLAILIGPTSNGERTLIGVIALAALASVGVLHVRALRACWESTPAVSRYIAPFSRALLGGLATFGAFELFDAGWLSILHSNPLRPGLRIAAAGLAAVLGLGWRRWKLDTRLRRRIG